MSTRRTFLRETAGHGLAIAGLSRRRHGDGDAWSGATSEAALAAADAESDIGSLYPFVLSPGYTRGVDFVHPVSWALKSYLGPAWGGRGAGRMAMGGRDELERRQTHIGTNTVLVK
jgi:hypothetical protein